MNTFASRRPAPAERCFVSPVVDAEVERVAARIADPELAWMFSNCLPNTLDTTVSFTDGAPPDTFVITGDIPAMWLRDSTAQVWPYLPFARRDERLRRMLAGVIHRQVACLSIDPYANAFERQPGTSHWASDITEMHPLVHERKWELDSPCAVIRLSHGYWQATGDLSPFGVAWQQAMRSVLGVLHEQQSGAGAYRFQRCTPNPQDSLPFNGSGWPSQACGLIRSAFRPSDDACTFPFLVPSNFLAAVCLHHLAELAQAVGQPDLANGAQSLGSQVQAALAALAEPLPYEIDGYGNQLLMDDANVPSLLSLPYLGACRADDTRYRRTREASLGRRNPFHARGDAGRGMGSPHTGPGTVWPLGLVMQALTSCDDAEIGACLAQLKASHAGTGFMHEAFDCQDAAQFSRPWFAWANSLFGELILSLDLQRPHLLARPCPGPA